MGEVNFHIIPVYGGGGSGNFGHAGRPGAVGGSGGGGGVKELSVKEKEAVFGYTKDDYVKINEHLRFGTEIDSQTKEQIRSLDSTLQKSYLDKEVTVYRGFRNDDLADKIRTGSDVVGSVFEDKGFVSTTIQGHVPGSFGGPFDHITAILHLPAGTNALLIGNDLSSRRGEYEVLLPRSTKFKITEAKQYGNPSSWSRNFFIHLEMVK